jgi:DNA (cytosine-5)-methyltransferase 1
MSPVAGTITANTGGMTRPAGNANELDFCVPVFSMITANTGANGLGVSKEIAPTLDRAQPAAIAQPIAFNARQDPDSWEEHTGPLDTNGSTQAISHSVVGPLFCHLGTINNQAVEAGHVVYDPIAIPISTQNALGRVNGIDEWPLGIFNDGDPAPTLSKSHGHAVGTNKSSDFAVRRLTPVECERLQGFPDNYTNIPNAADGPRYKALGNSMAVPVMYWIGKRIQFIQENI